jgi:colicin import membrane protein
MFTTFKRIAVVVLVPTVVGLGVWAEWTTLTTKFAMLGTSAAEAIESIPADLTTDGVRPDARATVPEIKPAPAPDRKPENGAAEQAPPQTAKSTAEPAKVDPAAQTRPAPATPGAPAAPKVKRLPFAIERRPEDGAAAQARVSAPATKIDVQPAQATPAPQPKPEVKPAAAAEQRPAQKTATKESEAAKPQAQDKPTPKSEAKSEVKAEVKSEAKPAAAAEQRSVQKTATKESEAAKPQAQDKPAPKSEVKSEAKSEAKPDDRAARKENAANREKAEQAAQSRNGRSASRERPSRSYDPDDVDPRKALTELRRSRSVADFYDRLEALWGMR